MGTSERFLEALRYLRAQDEIHHKKVQVNILLNTFCYAVIYHSLTVVCIKYVIFPWVFLFETAKINILILPVYLVFSLIDGALIFLALYRFWLLQRQRARIAALVKRLGWKLPPW